MTLTEAIVVRVSHDLAGAIGAFCNTVDLMKMDASFIGESVDLLETSAHQLTARLAFFRSLFGAETKSIDNLLVQRYLDTLAISVKLKGNVSSRLHLALIAVGLEFIGIGGLLSLEGNKLIISGKELNHNSVFIQALMGTTIPCDPKLVMALWLVELAKQEDLTIQIEADDQTITIALT